MTTNEKKYQPMLPTMVEKDVEEGLRSFVEREFPITTKTFLTPDGNIISSYLKTSGNLVKGPWLEVKIPFREDSTANTDALFPEVSAECHLLKGWKPFAHQIRSWKRMRWDGVAGKPPQSTIVATGTGSGKTECFMFPILDYVLRRKEELRVENKSSRGIKAIFIYPMNALASDQALRIAGYCEKIKKALLDSQKIKDNEEPIRVGLYTGAESSTFGGEKPDDGPDPRIMGPDHVITDRKTLRENPPDILLTNYKMLDFLLLRNEDQGLWDNCSADTLRYLVVDELHTFDGAQGTDLACLIRRLRHFVGLGEELVCIGTSATLGGDDGLSALREYASDIFMSNFLEGGDKFDDAIVIEDRLSADEYLQQLEDADNSEFLNGKRFYWPSYSEFRAITSPQQAGLDREEVINKAYKLFQVETDEFDPKKLGEILYKIPAFCRLIRDADSVMDIRSLASDWKRDIPYLKEYSEDDVLTLIRFLVSLISYARNKEGRVFLNVRVQLWLKEMRGMVATVSDKPRLITAEERDREKSFALPIVSCRECNSTAWGALLDIATGKISTDRTAFYRAWFKQSEDVRLLYPVTKEEFIADSKYRQGGEAKHYYRLCVNNKTLVPLDTENISDSSKIFLDDQEDCPICGQKHPHLIVWVPNTSSDAIGEDGRHGKMVDRCPVCSARRSMRIFGARSVTMSAAMAGHLNASKCNNDPKQIIFSDSTQDAAHRAGFLTSRNYYFVVRQAVAAAIRSLKDGEEKKLKAFLIELPEATKKRITSEENEDLNKARFASTFIPQDFYFKRGWQSFEEDSAQAALRYGKKENKEQKITENDVEDLKPKDPLSYIPKYISREERSVKEKRTNEERKSRNWSYFYDDCVTRLQWEAFVELSFRSQSGRTVELSGIGLLKPSLEMVKSLGFKLRNALAQSGEDFSDITCLENLTDRLNGFILGFLQHEKIKGAFDFKSTLGKDNKPNELNFYDYDRYTKSGNDWALNNSKVLPTYGKVFTPPSPLVWSKEGAPVSKFFESIEPKNQKEYNWFRHWFAVNFPEVLLLKDRDWHWLCSDFYRVFLQALTLANVLTQSPLPGDNRFVYLLNPEKDWRIGKTMKKAVCPRCGRSHMIAPEAEEFWRSMPCLSQTCGCSCHEILEVKPATDLVYGGTPHRVNAKEHTAHVGTKRRHETERSFIFGKNPWDVSVLSATPTLEMGIDIGDLSSVMLASVPPGQANYLQRIGRAGRRDGNALAMTICGDDPHSLFFWKDPTEMLAGEVTPPGVFLKAVAVLERQLLAFSLTCWRRETPKAEVPSKLADVNTEIRKIAKNAKGVRLDELIVADDSQPESFPFGFVNYCEQNAAYLFNQFKALLPNEGRGALNEEEIVRLRSTFLGNREKSISCLRARLIGALLNLYQERMNLIAEKKALKARLTKLFPHKDEDDENKQTFEELSKQRDALETFITEEYENKNVLNVLTDEGLLPNYAFPESGISIDSLVVRKIDKFVNKGHKSHRNDEVEERVDENHEAVQRFKFQRGAESGLSEVSPESVFYVNDYKLRIDRVDLKGKQVQKWRFCPHCSHCEPDTGSLSSVCPNCSGDWGDVAQTRDVLQIRSVYATADLKKDRIGDREETRQVRTQIRKVMVDVEKPTEGYCIPLEKYKTKFIYEYLPKITLRDFNFGSPSKEGLKMESGGETFIAPGFSICKECGHVKEKVLLNGLTGKASVGTTQAVTHEPTCKFAKKALAVPTQGLFADSSENNPWYEGLVLYREITSEALRIRVPLVFDHKYGVSQIVASLESAILLGLRRYFKGSIDHLKIIYQKKTIPVKNERAPKAYEHDLLIYDTVPGGTGYIKEIMSDEKGLLTILNVALKAMEGCDCETDGCYRCLYQYRDPGQRNEISKHCAIKVISAILEAKDQVRSIESADLSESSNKSESPFEEKLLDKILHHDEIDPASVREENGDYIFSMKGSKRVWKLAQQVEYLGLPRETRPDMVLSPYPSCTDSRYEMLIYADGAQYHATEQNAKGDIAKRRGILSSGRKVWTCFWWDLLDGDATKSDTFLDAVSACFPTLKIDWQKVCQLYAMKSSLVQFKNWHKNRFDMLIEWLKDPDSMQCQTEVMTGFLGWIIRDALKKPEICDNKPLAAIDALGLSADVKAFEYSQKPLCLWAFNVPNKDPRKTPPSVRVLTFDTSVLEDTQYQFNVLTDKTRWLMSFWGLVNVLQLSEGGLFIGDEEEPFDDPLITSDIQQIGDNSVVDAKTTDDARYEELCGLIFDDRASKVLERIKDRHGRLPDDVGVEIAIDGKVAFTAELWWKSPAVAVIFGEDDRSLVNNSSANCELLFVTDESDLHSVLERLNTIFNQ